MEAADVGNGSDDGLSAVTTDVMSSRRAASTKAFGRAEDVEFAARMADRGLTLLFAPDAIVHRVIARQGGAW